MTIDTGHFSQKHYNAGFGPNLFRQNTQLNLR